MRIVAMFLSVLLIASLSYGCAPQKSKETTKPTENITLSVSGMT